MAVEVLLKNRRTRTMRGSHSSYSDIEENQSRYSVKGSSSKYNYGIETMDRDGDGIISPDELKDHLQEVSVRLPMLMERLTLEKNLATTLVKIPFFAACLICFLIALVEFSPASDVAKVHTHLEDHYQLSQAQAIHTFAEIYQYIERFEKRNEELQATSAKYWCEDRYYSHTWNTDLLVPTRSCQSPRFDALSVGEQESQLRWVLWKTQNDPDWGASLGNSTSGSSSSHGSSEGEFETSCAQSSTRNSTSYYDKPWPPCVDLDMELALEEGIPGATCNSEASHVCEVDLGIIFCPKTCGYCAPFKYRRLHQFPKPALTMLPIVIYQTRFELADCHGYARNYEQQEVNNWLNLLPALDGQKDDRLIKCINRKKRYEEPYAIEQECGEGAGLCLCSPCSFNASKLCLKDTGKVDFHGIPVYPKVILEPHKDIVRMQHLDWLDIQTDTISLSTVVYTEGSEIFTSLTVDFSVDAAGNVKAHHDMISYRDLTNESKDTFIVCLVVCSAMAFIGVGLTLWTIWTVGLKFCNWSYLVFEVISRSLLFAYPLVLLFSWLQQIPMSEEVDQLLHAFLDMQHVNHRTIQEAMEKYFEVKTHMYEETTWLQQQRIVANLILYLQFWQLMVYFSAHPRMAMLTDTIYQASTNIVHFLFLFMLLFMMMAFMAHWQLGEYIHNFATYGDAISAQGRMIFGEFIYANGAEQLRDSMMFMYWLYAFTFMLVMWGLLLNFFLAIVVDAFDDITIKGDDAGIVKNFAADVFEVWQAQRLRWQYGWPTRNMLVAFMAEVDKRKRHLKTWLDDLDSDDLNQNKENVPSSPVLYPEELAQRFPEAFGDPTKLSRFLCHYLGNMPTLLCRRGDETGQVETARPVGREDKTGQAETVLPVGHEDKTGQAETVLPVGRKDKISGSETVPPVDAKEDKVEVERDTSLSAPAASKDNHSGSDSGEPCQIVGVLNEQLASLSAMQKELFNKQREMDDLSKQLLNKQTEIKNQQFEMADLLSLICAGSSTECAT